MTFQATSSAKNWVAKIADNVPFVVALGVLLSLILGFTLFAPQLGLVKWAEPAKQEIAYTNLAPIRTKMDNYELSASFSVQTNTADAKWVEKNKIIISQTLQAYISMINHSELRTPNGMIKLQDSMAKAVNKAFNTKCVQGVYVTNFTVQLDNV